MRRRDGRDADARRRKRRCDAVTLRELRRRRIPARRDLVRDDFRIAALAPDWGQTGAQWSRLASAEALTPA